MVTAMSSVPWTLSVGSIRAYQYAGADGAHLEVRTEGGGEAAGEGVHGRRRVRSDGQGGGYSFHAWP